jgi:hypothetical protein
MKGLGLGFLFSIAASADQVEWGLRAEPTLSWDTYRSRILDPKLIDEAAVDIEHLERPLSDEQQIEVIDLALERATSMETFSWMLRLLDSERPAVRERLLKAAALKKHSYVSAIHALLFSGRQTPPEVTSALLTLMETSFEPGSEAWASVAFQMMESGNEAAIESLFNWAYRRKASIDDRILALGALNLAILPADREPDFAKRLLALYMSTAPIVMEKHDHDRGTLNPRWIPVMGAEQKLILERHASRLLRVAPESAPHALAVGQALRDSKLIDAAIDAVRSSESGRTVVALFWESRPEFLNASQRSQILDLAFATPNPNSEITQTLRRTWDRKYFSPPQLRKLASFVDDLEDPELREHFGLNN